MSRPLSIDDNTYLHECNLVYLELALAYVRDGELARATQLIRTFDGAEMARKDERLAICASDNKLVPASPHDAREAELREEIAGWAEMLRRQGVSR